MTLPVVKALSISDSISSRLNASAYRGAVIHNYSRTCIIILERHAFAETTEPLVITLAEPAVENGPLNILVENFSLLRETSAAGSPVFYDGKSLSFAGSSVFLRDAVRWNPKPDWEMARLAHERKRIIYGKLLQDAQALSNHATLLNFLTSTLPVSESLVADKLSKRFETALVEMDRRSSNSLKDSLSFAAEHLAGLGGGLTPAGDDFLCGAMLALWLVRDDAALWCEMPAEIASRRTTTLSAALLREAAQGHCSMGWRRFIDALVSGEQHSLTSTLSGILSHGATSGGDSLAGFFWMVLKLEAVNHAPS